MIVYYIMSDSTWCWWCSHPHENKTLQMPYRYDERRRKFYTCGQFCSWSCMKSYAISKYGITRGSIICGNIIMMRKNMYNKIGHIKFAPRRERLKVFGGDLDIEDFRSDTLIDVEIPKEVETTPHTDRLIAPVINHKKLLEIQGSKGGNETLKLKREKPLQRHQSSLQTALGIVIKPKT